MARDDVFEVARSFRRRELGAGDRGLINPFGAQVVVDFYTQLGLSGYTYHMQIGTESAGVASTTTIADTLVWMLADQTAGVMFPLLYEVNVETVTTATMIEAMLEIDNAQNRYASGGTAFVPEPLNNRNYNTFSGTAYVGTDITAGAKTAVPGSIELARRQFSEDAIATPTPGDFVGNGAVYSVKDRPIAPQQGAASILCHFGATTADATGFGVLQIAQFPADLVPAA